MRSLCSDIWTLSLTVTFASQGQDWDTEELLQEDVTGLTEYESGGFLRIFRHVSLKVLWILFEG